MMSSSPQRGTFQINSILEDVENGTATAEDAQDRIDFYKRWQEDSRARELDPEWQKNNMEYDLRTSDWMVAKVKANEAYAQNLYAAMCNNEFQKNEVWLLLKGETWSCSWRYAGGIIADMRGQGDYIDWYCSGIIGTATKEDLEKMTPEEREQYHWYQDNFVSESTVTEEIREDLFKLGWTLVENKDDITI